MIFNWLKSDAASFLELKGFAESNAKGKLIHCVCENVSEGISQVDRYGCIEKLANCGICGSIYQTNYSSDEQVLEFYKHKYRKCYGFNPAGHEYYLIQRSYGKKIHQFVRSVSDVRFNSVIEVGGGTGGALEPWKDSDKYAIDLDREYAEVWKRNNISEMPENLDIGGANLLILHHVLEHIVDPFSYLKDLRVGVNFCGAVVVIPYLFASKRGFGYGQAEQNYFHPAHVHNFTYHGLKILAENLDLDIVGTEQSYFFGVPELYCLLYEREKMAVKSAMQAPSECPGPVIPLGMIANIRSTFFSLIGWMRQKL